MSAENSTSPFSARLGRTVNAGLLNSAVATVLAPVWNVAVMTGTVLDRLISAHERWRQRQALLALDDHLLKDIGLTRVDVEREANKRPWEE